MQTPASNLETGVVALVPAPAASANSSVITGDHGNVGQGGYGSSENTPFERSSSLAIGPENIDDEKTTSGGENAHWPGGLGVGAHLGVPENILNEVGNTPTT